MAKAKYKCLKCENEYVGTPGMQPPCSKCGHMYIKWLNYEEDPRDEIIKGINKWAAKKSKEQDEFVYKQLIGAGSGD